MFNINLGKFLAQLRTEKKITQEKLAEMLHIDKRKISRWECGNSPPEFELLIKLAEIFNVTLYELSICQRLKDDSLLEKTKKKLKTIKDLKKLAVKRKIMIFLSIIFGIFLGISAIYTIDNYNTVEIYELVSDDENFYIKGNYIKAKDYDLFTVTKLDFLNNCTKDFDISVSNVEYELEIPKRRVFFISKEINKTPLNSTTNLSTIIKGTSFSVNNLYYLVNEKDNSTLIIKYTDNKNVKQSITLKFKLVRIFQNIF